MLDGRSDRKIKVLIGGGGITAAVVVYFIKSWKQWSSKLEIDVWEKDAQVGGRFGTVQAEMNASLHADIGAQYLTLKNPDHHGLYTSLVERGILCKFTGSIVGANAAHETQQHFVAPFGMKSVVEYFLANSCVSTGKQLIALERLPDEQQWKAIDQDQVDAKYDIVILSLPVNNLSMLQGNCLEDLQPVINDMQASVSMSKRYALVLFFEPTLEVAHYMNELGWVGQYVSHEKSSIVRFICCDTAKRSVSPTNGYALTIHASVPFSISNWRSTDEEITAILMTETRQLMTELPSPKEIQMLRWAPSQVSQAYSTKEKSKVIASNPPLIIAGDAFTTSGFDHCIDSAESVLTSMKTLLNV